MHKTKNVDIKQQLLEVERRGCGTVQIGGFTFDQNILREKLARAIILHEYPLSIVDHVAFKDFASSLQPLFKMVSRNGRRRCVMSSPLCSIWLLTKMQGWLRSGTLQGLMGVGPLSSKDLLMIGKWRRLKGFFLFFTIRKLGQLKRIALF